jgi:hypothetical protein
VLDVPALLVGAGGLRQLVQMPCSMRVLMAAALRSGLAEHMARTSAAGDLTAARIAHEAIGRLLDAPAGHNFYGF